MSTLVPPRTAKRQRLANAASSLEAEHLASEGKHGPNSQSVVIQLQSSDGDNQLLGPPISLPAEQTGQKELQSIVNQLRRVEREKNGNGKGKDKGKKKGKEWKIGEEDSSDEDSEEEEEVDRPFTFHVTLSGPEEIRLEINSSILTDILSSKHSTSLGLSTESILSITYSPQAVFKVKTISRCSSTLSGHSSPILCSSFSPTGSLLITGSGDKTARIWDLETETPLHVLMGHGGYVLVTEWEPTERKVATGDQNGEIRVWKCLDESWGKTGGKAWGSKSGKMVEEEEKERRNATSTLAAEESTTTTISSEEQPFKMKAAEKRALRHASPTSIILKGHSKWITSLSFEPLHLVPSTQSPRLASSSKDSTVKVWNTLTKLCQFTLGGHTASVNSVRWGGSHEGCLYTASSDRTIKIWNSKDGRLIRTLNEHSHWVNSISLSTEFVMKTGGFAHDYNYKPTVEEKEGLKETQEQVQEREVELRKKALKRFKEVIKNGGPEIMVSGSEDSTLFLWAPQIGDTPSDPSNPVSTSSLPSPKKPLARLTGHQRSISQVLFSPDGRLLASSSWDSSIRLWDPRSITPQILATHTANGSKVPNPFIRTFRGHLSAVYRIDWSSDSRMLISGSKDSTLKLWNVRDGKIKKDLPGHEDEVYCVGWGGTGGERGGGKVASGGKDGKVKIWRH